MKNRWRASEVIAYLETKIQDDVATHEETELYEDFKWNGKLNKTNYALKSLVREMNTEFKGN